MKKILILVGSFFGGLLITLAGIALGSFLFTDMTWATFLEKYTALKLMYVLGITGLSIVLLILIGFLQVIIHEGGHLIFGLLAGFRFVSFRVGSLTLIRKDGRFKFKRFSVAGTGGQCLLFPPEGELKATAINLCNMGGVFMNFFTALMALILWLTLKPESPVLTLILFLFMITGFLLALLNGIPLKFSGINNDGYNMMLAMRNDLRASQDLQMQLRVNAFSQNGVRIKDMPKEWFEDNEVTNYKDALQVGNRMLVASRYTDLHQFEKARTIYRELLEHEEEIIGIYVNEIRCELLFLEFIGECREEEIEKLYTKEVEKYVETYKKCMSGKQLLLCASAFYRDHDREKAMKIYEEVIRTKESFLIQGDLLSNIELMKEILGISSFPKEAMQ